MRTETFHVDDLARLLRRSQIATMAELKKALGTEVDLTVFRKLKQLACRTNYSHRGSGYTLDETAHFGEDGLWSCRSVWFSRQGTLLATADRCSSASARTRPPSPWIPSSNGGCKKAACATRRLARFSS